MAKVALLIGVGEYLPSSGLQNLAAAARDVAAMRDVLVQPGIGGFAEADVTVLLNPAPQGMREALERLFAGRKSDDLVLLYFSGHGVVDDYGKFHLTTAQTDQGLLNSTAIAAGFVHGLMAGQGSKRQVVILDCCFSGAFAQDMKAKGEVVNLQPQLGGRGRAVLTSSSATEYSFEQKESELSVYTACLVEGLRTGMADMNGDGLVSVDELHHFAQSKVLEMFPAMQPKIYAVEEGYRIVLAQVPIDDPLWVYRQAVERLAKQRNGQLSSVIVQALEKQAERLGLAAAVTADIRNDVLRPYVLSLTNIEEYEQALRQVLQPRSRITPQDWSDLQYLQQTLGLTDESIHHLVKSIKIMPLVKQRFQLPLHGFTALILPPPLRELSGSRWLFGGAMTAVLSIGLLASFRSSGLLTNRLPQHLAAPIMSQPTPTMTAEELFQQGQDSYDNEKYQAAIAKFDQAIKQKPDYADAYYQRGLVYKELEDMQKGLADFDQAIKFKSDYADAYYDRAVVYTKLEETQKALADYRKAVDLDLSTIRRKRASAAIKELCGWGCQ
jgi:uncharacterized caspase-like protein